MLGEELMIHSIRFVAACLVVTALSACGRSEPAVSFASDVKPILQKRCGECHAPGQPGYEASQLGFATYDELMKGTKFGPVVVPGDSLGSNLIILVEGRADPSIAMPHGDNEPLLKGEIETLKVWIDQGAVNN
jgi:uncharacterized membrane protein